MQPSPEIQALIEQAFRSTSVAEALAGYSSQPGVVFIGTDPKEWFDNLAALTPMMQQAVEAMGGTPPADLSTQAMQEGTVGWFAYRWTGHLPNGSLLHFRVTGTCHQENGAWKVVQFHVSVGVPDELAPTIAQPAG